METSGVRLKWTQAAKTGWEKIMQRRKKDENVEQGKF